MADQDMDNEQDALTPGRSSDDELMADGADAQEPRDDADASESAVSMADKALEDADSATQSIREQAEGLGEPGPMDMPEFQDRAAGGELTQSIGLLSDVSLDVTIELGRTRMYVEDVLRLNANSIVELDKAAGDPVDIYVNDCHVARGEVLVLNENFCVRISEIVTAPVGQAQEA